LNPISRFLGQDHQRCDELFVRAEHLAAHGQFTEAGATCRAFIEAMEQHFGMEEQVLFPAFEDATGMVGGPTALMRHEHEQMRGLFREMATALDARQDEDFLGATETLLILMQQHNAKEEQILYPATDRVLPGSDLVRVMQERTAQ
jgi:hemerythrin-like domain-containing protein